MQPSERNTEPQNVGYENPPNPFDADTEPRQVENGQADTLDSTEPTPDNSPLGDSNEGDDLDPSSQLAQIRTEIDQLTAQEPSPYPEQADQDKPAQPSDRPPTS